MTSPTHPDSPSNGITTSAIFTAKGEARDLRASARARGEDLSQSAALEQVAHARGFRDWNALSAHLAAAEAESAEQPTLFPWQQIDEPLPQFPIPVVQPHELPRQASIAEMMRWARQLEFIATKVSPDDRPESMELIGARVPYVLEQSRSRWPDGLFHLCDRGYDAFKGIAFSLEQLRALGLPEWNQAYGQHGGRDAFTLVGDDWRYTRKEDMLKRLARLLASLALTAGQTR